MRHTGINVIIFSFYNHSTWVTCSLFVLFLMIFQKALQALGTRRAFQQQLKEMLDNETPIKEVSQLLICFVLEEHKTLYLVFCVKITCNSSF